MRWSGFRKVRGQVYKRIRRRLRELNLPDTNAYRVYLEKHGAEWEALDGFCRITISRFYRDKQVFAQLGGEVIPVLAQRAMDQGQKKIRIWSAGCGSGEEPFTIALLWNLVLKRVLPDVDCLITATDIDPTLLKRAKEACYPPSSIKELPEDWLAQGFTLRGTRYCLLPEYQSMVNFVEQDIRSAVPDGLFHIVLCRNLAFTYYDINLQEKILKRIDDVLLPGGAIITGAHESLPRGVKGFTPWMKDMPIFRKGPAD